MTVLTPAGGPVPAGPDAIAGPPGDPNAGLLELRLVRDQRGRTRIAVLRQHFPQRVTVPMYLDPDGPGSAMLCVQNPTGGVFPGDRLRTRMRLDEGAGLLLTAQSATQVHAGHRTGQEAAQEYELHLGEGSVLEHAARTTVPHARSGYRQRTRIRLAEGSVYLGWDSVAAGRVGHGERFAFHRFRADCTVEYAGAVLSRDTVRLEPGRRDPGRPGLLAGHDLLCTVLLLAPGRPAELDRLHERLRARLDGPGATVSGAVSPLPGGCGLALRLLARRAPALAGALASVWTAARAELLGRYRLPERVAL
jgi:urease accessory protein